MNGEGSVLFRNSLPAQKEQIRDGETEVVCGLLFEHKLSSFRVFAFFLGTLVLSVVLSKWKAEASTDGFIAGVTLGIFLETAVGVFFLALTLIFLTPK